MENEIKIVDNYVRSYDKKAINREFNILEDACFNNNIEIVKILIKAFGNKLPIDEYAIYSACYNNNLEIVKELIKNYGNKLPIEENAITLVKIIT